MISKRQLYAAGEPMGDSATCAKPGGRGRIYGGGGGSSSSSSNTSTTTNNVDKRQVVDNGGLGVTTDNSNVTVTATDHGAIQAAGTLASQALTTNSNNFNTLMDTVKLLTQSAADALKANTSMAQNLTTTTQSAYADAASQASGQKNLVYAGLAVVGVVAFSFMSKKG